MTYTNSPLVSYKNITSHKKAGRKNISRFTPHVFVGQVTAKQGVDYFKNTDRQCSANYVIGHSGELGLSVDEKDTAWTSSSSANDSQAITVEIASDKSHPYAISDKAWETLINLAYDICKRYNKTKMVWIPDKDKALSYKVKDDELLVTVHRWFNLNKSCPGEYVYNRLGKLVEIVNNKLKEDTGAMGEKLNSFEQWAVDIGLFAGYGDGKYHFDQPLTRGQLCIVLYRFAKWLGRV